MYRGQLEYLLRFQSTLPRRERQHPPFCKSKRGSISIHAPAKGATIFKIIKNTDCFYFNPRSREGSDRGRQRLSIKLYNFNPRSREGSDDLICAIVARFTLISIHAPAKGATNSKFFHFIIEIFQSTLPRRERRFSMLPLSNKKEISIHAPAKGATAFINIFSLAVRLFFISSHQ